MLFGHSKQMEMKSDRRELMVQWVATDLVWKNLAYEIQKPLSFSKTRDGEIVYLAASYQN